MNKHDYFVRDLKGFKKSGIQKVELLCPGDCKCCKDLKGKQIKLNDIKELPMQECEYPNCYGKYCAIVEFD